MIDIDIHKIPPKTIAEFRNTTETENFQIPEKPENRKCTDIGFLIFLIHVVVTTIIFVAYNSTIGTNYNRFLNGYDKCGDTCGISNRAVKTVQCSGKDLTNKPFMTFKFTDRKNDSKTKIEILPDVCDNRCDPPNRLMFHRCIPDADQDRKANIIINFAEFCNDLKLTINTIIIPMAIIGLVSLCFFLGLRYSSRITVFGAVGITLISLLCFTSYIWYWFSENQDNTKLLYIGIVSSCAIFFQTIFICYFYNRYSIIIKMFKETTQTIFSMPSLVFVPLGTLAFLTVVTTSIVFLGALISTNHYLREIPGHPSAYEYRDTKLATAGLACIVIFGIWTFALANGCQCMIVAGAISTYYFTRDKSTLQKPVYASFFVLMRYHLGTVAFGSLCITFLSIGRLCFEFISQYIKQDWLKKRMKAFVSRIEATVEYLSKRAYIQTAMHGEPLYSSGKRAARLLWANLLDTIVPHVVGNFIVISITISVVLLGALFAIIVYKTTDLKVIYFWTIVAIGAGISGTIIYFFAQVLNVAVETIFICFCEDKLLHSGNNNEFFMSQELKTLIDEAKKIAN
ncbi:choline transporter-like protein 1 isoform X2 [Tribolium madens]|uniref:choline transporter-like protein 1 isoform X2 n=1 Tax=Tribolium madens TaxID=41895 RepID=UPI001CF72C14|nr:choline transporter-like protein 1 isoform X2 [Tribolium madens]